MKISFASSLVWSTAILVSSGCAVESATEPDEAETTASSIVGGQATSAFPAVGALTQGGSPFCTGTAIAPRVVVTAAHCLAGQSAASIAFAIGPNAFAPTSRIRATRIAVHPAYDANRILNDIGVVVLSQDAPVTPIGINTTALTAASVGQPLVFVGYGATNGVTGSGVGTKRQVTIPIAQVASTQFAYADRQKNTCFGDSGGPALGQNAAGATVVVGVTSYGDARCRQYGVDTRVDAFQSFIAQAGAL